MSKEPRALETGDILLYKGKGFTSFVIQAFTDSPYNHVAVVAAPHICLLIESNTGRQSGVRAVDLRMVDFTGIDVFRVKPGFAFDRDKMVSYLVSRLGRRFDYGGIFSLGLLKILSALTFLTWAPFNSFQKEKDYFCSELTYEAFAAGGLDIAPQVDAADITSPGDIAKSRIVEKVSGR
jgi:hypothetical protein